MIDNQELFKRYVLKIKALSSDGNITRDKILKSDFLLESEKHRHSNLEIYYVPFEYINEDAKVVLVGITPGWTQVEIAYRQAGNDLQKGLPFEDIFRNVDMQASFAGTMRKNLTSMLDELGLQKALHISSCGLLFSEYSHLVHTTSAIRYPVFINGNNYTGYNPDITDDALLRKYLNDVLSKELNLVSKALIIPLGKSPSTALQYLITKELVDPDRCLFGFPHPSGANGHRKKQFEQMKPQLEQKIIKWFVG
jgi:hypothetical protein